MSHQSSGSPRKVGSPLGYQRLFWVFGAILFAAVGYWYFTTPDRDTLEQVAVDAIRRNDFALAEKTLLRIRPRDAAVLQVLADVAYRSDRKRDCINWLEKLAEVSPQPLQGFLDAGGRAFEFGLPESAEGLYRRAIRMSPTALEPYSRLARLYLVWQRGRELRRLISDADHADVPLKDDPALIWMWVVSDRVDWYDDDAERWLRRAYAENGDPDSAAAMARLLLHSKRLDEAREFLNSTTESTTLPILLTRATTELEDGHPQEALSTMQLPATATDNSPEAWLLRGRIWQECGDLEGALHAFEFASTIDPWLVEAIYQQGRLLARLGRTRESEEVLRRAAVADEVSRRCLQLLKSPQPNRADVETVLAIARPIGDCGWNRLVERLLLDKDIPEQGQAECRLSISMPQGLRPEFSSARATHVTPSVTPPVSDSRHEALAHFLDVTNSLGVKFVYEYGHAPERWLMETLGGGVAVLDYDRDGWQDLFFAQGGHLPIPDRPAPDGRLWRNQHAESFGDVTDPSNIQVPGYAHGCAAGDLNNDGFPDLLVCRYGGLTLMMNQGDGTWSDATAPDTTAGKGTNAARNSDIESNKAWNTSAVFSDLDNDGDLDVFLARYCMAPFSDKLRTCRNDNRYEACRPNTYPAETDTLLENKGDGQFADVSESTGIHADRGYGLGVIAADFDDDGATEVFVGNDTTHNFLWHRKPRSPAGSMPSFEDRGLIAGVALDGSGRAEACMGIACGDVDGDQRLDLFVTNFSDETCTFYHNLGQLMFEDQTTQFGLSNAGRKLMGWGCQFFDANNDGWLDLVILNGHLHDVPQHPQFYINRGGKFVEQSPQADSWFAQARLGRSVATWDYNRDGRLDLVTTNQTEAAGILRNDSSTGNYVAISLVGRSGPRDATGTVIRARVNGIDVIRLVSSQGGYLSACSSDVVIGTGNTTVVEHLTIQWPRGDREEFGSLATGHRYSVCEGTGKAIQLSSEE